jgi:hypothetical protein
MGFAPDGDPALVSRGTDTVSGTPVPPEPTPHPGRRPIVPARQALEELVYTTMHKEREGNRIVAVRRPSCWGIRGG